MAPGRLFGTDGVRGEAGTELGVDLALRLGRAAASVLAAGSGRSSAVVGSDGRASGEMLESAVVAGLASQGVDVHRVGVLPTPGVARLTQDLGASFGVVLSASHNPAPDNGIKLFGPGGRKLADAVEERVEDALEHLEDLPRLSGRSVGRVREADDAAGRYVAAVAATCPVDLAGLRVVVDCANGAASAVAPAAYRRAGADVVAVADSPDGWNINDGVGSTHVAHVAAAVREHGADLGVAHDGDADRCLAVDAAGELVDGDQILALAALDARERGRLPGGAVVTTVMTNLGFTRAMDAAGLRVVQTPVGDRYVLEAMHAQGLAVGGEQSGHVVLLDHATTGDGLVTALQVMARVVSAGRPLAELASVVQRLPQVLVNVRVADRSVVDAPGVREATDAARAELGERGRVLLRPSGTEPLVRVMVEAESQQQADEVAERVAEAVRAVA